MQRASVAATFLVFFLVALSTGSGCTGGGSRGADPGRSSSSGGSSSGTSGASSTSSSSGSSSSSGASSSSGSSGTSSSSGAGAACGNGTIDPGEQCDDGNTHSGDGCSGDCLLEQGWVCPAAAQPCRPSVCGDRVTEGWEQCDDGNTSPFDGCSATCMRELDCSHGACTGFCGDGIVSGNEQCDDGNSVDGDGCSKACTLEAGATCENAASALPDAITVPVIYRDFRGVNEGAPWCATGLLPVPTQLTTGCDHPDFEAFGGSGAATGLLEPALVATTERPGVLMPRLGAQNAGHRLNQDGSRGELQITSADTFAQWYVDVPGVNRTALAELHLARVAGTSTYTIDLSAAAGGFFPLDGFPTTCTTGQPCSWGSSPGQAHDYGFTSEVRYQFTFQGGEVLKFVGDDDVWVFIGGKLAVDLGGMHTAVEGTITLDDVAAAQLGLVKGSIYEIALFHAERHSTGSNFSLTLGGFIKNTTVCTKICGNKKIDPGEDCDLGPDNGKGKGCSATCRTEGEW